MKINNKKNISLDKFIHNSLYAEKSGYYMKNNPFGKDGDFITSPNISILFSEMIAIWCVAFWENLGCPKKINIIELGAGNGELMLQMIKVFEKFKKFKISSNYYILEKSSFLKKIQKKKLISQKINWIDSINEIKNGPNIFLANEFFDALPIKQFIKKKNVWFEKYVVNKNRSLDFFEKKISKEIIEKLLKQKIFKNQKFIEFSPLANEILASITRIVKKNNGGVLIIDYGYESKKMFDTLQSVKKHKKNNLLENIYKADITHLINFNFLKKKSKI